MTERGQGLDPAAGTETSPTKVTIGQPAGTPPNTETLTTLGPKCRGPGTMGGAMATLSTGTTTIGVAEATMGPSRARAGAMEGTPTTGTPTTGGALASPSTTAPTHQGQQWQHEQPGQ